MNSLLDNLQSSRSALFKKHGIERAILSPGHLFDLSNPDKVKDGEKDFFLRFLSTLNLCNRSSRRHVRNLHDDGLQRKIEAEHPRSWIFPQSPKWPVFDNHKFTITGKRNDETLELGGYKTVHELIGEIKNNLNKNRAKACPEVTDKDIASWIRDIISGNRYIVQNGVLKRSNSADIKIEDFKKLADMMVAQLIKITYLLFGSEVMRNPASLIHHQMMIDLILVNKMTWKDALDSKLKKRDKKTNKVASDGGEMPMSMQEAVSSARILHNKFISFMPHPYYYDPLEVDDDTAAAREGELLDRENAIYEEWFTKYKPKDDVTRLKVLSKAINRWYALEESDEAVDRLTARIMTPQSRLQTNVKQTNVKLEQQTAKKK